MPELFLGDSTLVVLAVLGPEHDVRFGVEGQQLKFRSFEAVEHRIAESPNEWDFDVLN